MVNEPTTADAGSLPERHLVLTLGAVRCAVPVGWVREVIRLPSLPKVATASDTIQGVIKLRGRTIPVVDLRIPAEAPTAEFSRCMGVVVLQLEVRPEGVGLFGLVVDAIGEVCGEELDRIRPVTELLSCLDLALLLERTKPRGALQVVLDGVRDAASTVVGNRSP